MGTDAASTAGMGDSAREVRALFATLDERIWARDREGAILAAPDAVHEGRIDVANLHTQVLRPLMVEIGGRSAPNDRPKTYATSIWHPSSVDRMHE